MDLFQLNKISLKDNPKCTEKMIQEYILNNPKILGLGDLELRDKERLQPSAGRLDLLFQVPDSTQRYEVEIQLGKTDASHIIRTIEYWDIERKRYYPQYDHCAVIVAEDITSRFSNVIQLFNGNLPIIAIQMNAYEIGGKIGLSFAKIIDKLELGLVDEDEEITETIDRSHWEGKSSKQSVELVDKLLNFVTEIDPLYNIKYNQHYIGLTKDGKTNNFISFRPRKDFLLLTIKLDQTDEITDELNKSGLELLDYDVKKHNYRIILNEKVTDTNNELLSKLFKKSYDENSF